MSRNTSISSTQRSQVVHNPRRQGSIPSAVAHSLTSPSSSLFPAKDRTRPQVGGSVLSVFDQATAGHGHASFDGQRSNALHQGSSLKVSGHVFLDEQQRASEQYQESSSGGVLHQPSTGRASLDEQQPSPGLDQGNFSEAFASHSVSFDQQRSSARHQDTSSSAFHPPSSGQIFPALLSSQVDGGSSGRMMADHGQRANRLASGSSFDGKVLDGPCSSAFTQKGAPLRAKRSPELEATWVQSSSANAKEIVKTNKYAPMNTLLLTRPTSPIPLPRKCQGDCARKFAHRLFSLLCPYSNPSWEMLRFSNSPSSSPTACLLLENAREFVRTEQRAPIGLSF